MTASTPATHGGDDPLDSTATYQLKPPGRETLGEVERPLGFLLLRQRGWQKHDTLVIDRDLGLTGKTAADRPGFQELVLSHTFVTPFPSSLRLRGLGTRHFR